MTTPYQNTETGAFGLSAAAVRALLPHVSFPDDADLTEHGFAPYALMPVPDAGWWQTITEIAPVDGQQAWEVSDRLLPEVRAAWSDRVTAKRDAAFEGGYAPTTGALAGHTLQVRDDRDKINWLTSQASYLAAIQGGHGAAPGATFRTAANDTIVTSYAEGFEIIVVGMAQWGAAIMNRSWALKDEGAAAETLTELLAIDIETGWP